MGWSTELVRLLVRLGHRAGWAGAVEHTELVRLEQNWSRKLVRLERGRCGGRRGQRGRREAAAGRRVAR